MAVSANTMIATSHSLAVDTGLNVLKSGGNAIDAAIAAAAVLHVVEPMSAGIGGDMFAMVYEAATGKLHGLNASGRAPKGATIEEYKKRGFNKIPEEGIFSVTVPGALSGWKMLLDRFGTRTLKTLSEPAINYARDGFEVAKVIGGRWGDFSSKLKKNKNTARVYLKDGIAPKPGELMRNKELASTFELIASEGIDVFYKGEIAREIVNESGKHGGFLSMEDLAGHTANWVDPISIDYRGHTVYELPPNTHGLVALQALKIAEGFDPGSMDYNSPEYLHKLIESIKIAYADGLYYVADPEFYDVPIDALLEEEYLAKRRGLVTDTALEGLTHGLPEGGTVYISVVDQFGNAVSFIESLFMPFGSGVTVGDTGILLQNRGTLFSMDPGHPNKLEPGKRPYHTIIPSIVLKGGKPWLCYGMVGGFIQPQGHLQLLCSLIDHGFDLQDALDAPRFYFREGKRVAFEKGMPQAVVSELEKRGHEIDGQTGYFGAAQAIMFNTDGTLSGASDPRKDGRARGV